MHTIIYQFKILFEGVSLTFGVKGKGYIAENTENNYFKFSLSVVI